jgi:hypothetical protein
MCTSAVYGMEHEIKMPPPLEHELIKQQLIAAGFKEDHPAIKNLTAEKPASSEINASELTEAQKTDIKELTKYGYHPYAAHVIATQADADKKISIEDAIRKSDELSFKVYDPDAEELPATAEHQAPTEPQSPVADKNQTVPWIKRSDAPVLSRPEALDSTEENARKQNVLDEQREALLKEVAAGVAPANAAEKEKQNASIEQLIARAGEDPEALKKEVPAGVKAENATKEEDTKAATSSPAEAEKEVQTTCHINATGIKQQLIELRDIIKKFFSGKHPVTDSIFNKVERDAKKLANEKSTEKIRSIITSLTENLEALSRYIATNRAYKAVRTQIGKIITQMRNHVASVDKAVTEAQAAAAKKAEEAKAALQAPAAIPASSTTAGPMN